MHMQTKHMHKGRAQMRYSTGVTIYTLPDQGVPMCSYHQTDLSPCNSTLECDVVQNQSDSYHMNSFTRTWAQLLVSYPTQMTPLHEPLYSQPDIECAYSDKYICKTSDERTCGMPRTAEQDATWNNVLGRKLVLRRDYFSYASPFSYITEHLRPEVEAIGHRESRLALKGVLISTTL